MYTSARMIHNYKTMSYRNISYKSIIGVCICANMYPNNVIIVNVKLSYRLDSDHAELSAVDEGGIRLSNFDGKECFQAAQDQMQVVKLHSLGGMDKKYKYTQKSQCICTHSPMC